MRSVEEQLALIADAAVQPEPVRVAISDALGLRSAEQVVGNAPVPGFDQAAVDGFAIRAVDSEAEDLPIVGEVNAGSRQPLRLQPRQVVRVYTGAPIPTLADAVLPDDWAARRGRRVTAIHRVLSGDFVHRRGADVQEGDVLLGEGTVLNPSHIALLAAAGRAKVLVYPRPRVAIMSVGAELIDLDRAPGLGQVYDANSYGLAAAAREAGADVHRVGIIAGESRRLKEIIEGQLLRSEVLVIAGAVGGASSARIREVLGEFGDIDYGRVAMHPGSTQGFGVLGPESIPTFLLPPNPVSGLIVFETMVRPLLHYISGRRSGKRRIVEARAVHSFSSIEGRRGFIRGQLMRDRQTDEFLVDPLGATAGAPVHLLGSHSEANCLIHIPEDRVDIAPGEIVDVLFLANRA